MPATLRVTSACVLAIVLTAGACTSDPPTEPAGPTVTAQPADRDQLAGIAAAAKDQRYVTLQPEREPQTAILSHVE